MGLIMLPSGKITSRIGYGCAALLAGRKLTESQALIDAAIESGIRHFDVAPIYGQGLAEDVLGVCLANARTPVTITTKVGLARPLRKSGVNYQLQAIARSALRFAPTVRRKLGQRAYSTARRTAFGQDDVEASLAESLRRLRRDQIDVLLLHEPEVEDLTDELIVWLERQRVNGTAGVIGFGARKERVPAILARWPEAQFVQTNWAPGEPTPFVGDRLLSLHGAARALALVRERLQRDVPFSERVSEVIGGSDISDDVLVRMLSATALAEKPDAMLLISSKRPERVRSFVGEQIPGIAW